MSYTYIVVANQKKTRIHNIDLSPKEFLDELFFYSDGLTSFGIETDHFLVYLDETETKHMFIPVYGTEEPDPVLFIDDEPYVKNKTTGLEKTLKNQWLTIGGSVLHAMNAWSELDALGASPPWFHFVRSFLEHLETTDPDLHLQYRLHYMHDHTRIKASITTYYSPGAIGKMITRLKSKVGYAFYQKFGIDEVFLMLAEVRSLCAQ